MKRTSAPLLAEAPAATRILLLPATGGSAADQERCRAFVDFLHRRTLVENGETADETPSEKETPPEKGAIAQALLRLGGKGLLSYVSTGDGEVDIFYNASPEASRSMLERQAGCGWPEPVRKKQAAALRVLEGALFRLPAEDAEGALEVFITDWSPCPAACAVAIHRSHPFAADLDKPASPWFTGRHVRHPLTGDLLPVWVADWVRPDFGTGAVLVNPAHDPTDLAFSRAVGLPIRFALASGDADASHASWPVPPVVRTGRAIRTGPYDGLTAEEASERYFQVLASRGLARRFRDVHVGRRKIGRLIPDPKGDLAWSSSREAMLPAAASPGAPRFRLAEADLCAAVLSVDLTSRLLLVGSASEVVGSLLTLCLLYFDLEGAPLAPSAVFSVQKVQESKIEAPSEVLRLLLLVGAPLDLVAVVKQQTIEQIQRFLRIHRELLDAVAEGSGRGADDSVSRFLCAGKAAVLAADPACAFGLLQQAQKQLCEMTQDRRAAVLPSYFVLTQVATGLEVPSGLEIMRIWRQL